eukprot:TRINITY_DN6478_c0_g1_i1.p1 TRINITY_DN6478_c0_g1~~TRINITY_DN6478_c0_g1_i1.p1  ORF type:complete len:375 (+),score=62.52 TRINITY_DN6478_c0_g1_i1:119-1243(+)
MRKQSLAKISVPYAIKKNELSIQKDGTGRVLLQVLDKKGTSPIQEKKSTLRNQVIPEKATFISHPTGFKKEYSYSTYIRNDSTMTISVKFPDGYPFEVKTVQMNKELSVAGAIALLQDTLGLSNDKRRNFGFYIHAKNVWLNPEHGIGQYNGLQFLNYIEYKENPDGGQVLLEEVEVEEGDYQTFNLVRQEMYFVEPHNSDLSTSSEQDSELNIPSPSPPPALPKKPKIPPRLKLRTESPQREEPPLQVPEIAPNDLQNVPEIESQTSHIVDRTDSNVISIEQQLSDCQQMLIDGAIFLEQIQMERDNIQKDLEMEQDENERLRKELRRKESIIFVQAQEIAMLKQQLKEEIRTVEDEATADALEQLESMLSRS